MRPPFLLLVLAAPLAAQHPGSRDTVVAASRRTDSVMIGNAPLGNASSTVDTAAARWMRDTVAKDLAGHLPMTVGEPRFSADTAWLTASRTETTLPDRLYEFRIEYRFERRDSRWVLTPERKVIHLHGGRAKP